MPLSVDTLMHIQMAYDAIKANNLRTALREVENFEAAFAREWDWATSIERMDALVCVANFYESLGDFDKALERFKVLCSFAEKEDPGTTETAGEYAKLARVLERVGQLSPAVDAWEASAKHLMIAGTWDKFRDGYEKHMKDLRNQINLES